MGCIGKKRHLILVIFYFLSLDFLYVVMVSSNGVHGVLSAEAVFSVVLLSPYAHACPAIKRVVSLFPWSVGWPPVTECGRSDAMTDLKSQFLNHHVKKEVQGPCQRRKHSCSRSMEALQPAACSLHHSHTWQWGTFDPPADLGQHHGRRRGAVSLSATSNCTSAESWTNKMVDVMSHWLLG